MARLTDLKQPSARLIYLWPMEALASRRLRREYETMAVMVRIFCANRHGGVDGPCSDCREFLTYAERRLEKCPYGAAKPTCAKCPIHCYKRDQRELARTIMRYAGPRMTWRHPWLALMHLLDRFRKVEHPMVNRRARSRAQRTAGK